MKICQEKMLLKILQHDKDLQPIFFHIYDGKNYDHLIWDKLYPPYSNHLIQMTKKAIINNNKA